MSETIVVHNGSQRAIKTAQGILPIGGSLEMDVEEAKKILGYAGIRDAATLVPKTADNITALKKKVWELEEEIKNLNAKLNGSAPSDTIPPVKEIEPEPELEVAGTKGKKGRGK